MPTVIRPRPRNRYQPRSACLIVIGHIALAGPALGRFLKIVMIVGYICGFFMGALMERRILLLCGLAVAAFVLTFAFSSRYFGLCRSDAAPSARAATQPAAQPPDAVATPTGETAPAAAPAAAAMNPPPALAPPEPAQSEPYSAPDGDSGERPARGDRAAEHSARTR
jgi:hypothetical protein